MRFGRLLVVIEAHSGFGGLICKVGIVLLVDVSRIRLLQGSWRAVRASATDLGGGKSLGVVLAGGVGVSDSEVH